MAVSFFYTNKTATVVKNMDDIMIQIKDEQTKYEISPIDATITGNTIIPGISGQEVDINASYNVMKKIGKYSSNLLKYKKIKPTISVTNNYNKYIISGNPEKREVSFIFLVKDENIDSILSVLDDSNIKANFFLDGNWFEKNNDKVISLINNNHNVGNLSYNLDYTNSSFVWMNTIVTKVGNQQDTFCYATNDSDLDICARELSYTIKPSLVIKENPLLEVKKNATSGSIISFSVTSKVSEELPLIIKYLKSRDYKIVNLTELITE